MGANPLLTLIILVAGVVGGLVVVILVIIVCKYRLKSRVTIRRRGVVQRERPDDVPQLKPLLWQESPDKMLVPAIRDFQSTFMKTSLTEDNGTTHIKPTKSSRFNTYINGAQVRQYRGDEQTKESDIEMCASARKSSLDAIIGEPAFIQKFSHRECSNEDYPSSLTQQPCTSASLHSDHEHSISPNLVLQKRDLHRTFSAPVTRIITPQIPPVLSIPSQKHISVEIHENPHYPSTSIIPGPAHDTQNSLRQTLIKSPLCNIRKHKKAGPSKSVDNVHSIKNSKLTQTRNFYSFDDANKYDNLRITEFRIGTVCSTDHPIAEETALDSLKACVRYNDPGSVECLDEHFEFYEPDTSDSREENNSLTGPKKYRDIWHLRATFEEEEECSDTIRLQDTTSPEPSPEESTRGISELNKQEFLSDTKNDRSTCQGDGNCNSPPDETPKNYKVNGGHIECSDNILSHPESENKETKLQCVNRHRFQSRGNSADTSFDSFDNAETDCDGSDTTSKHGFTTSFDSTDNTDSTTDSRLKQMRGDSGYKSIENPAIPSSSDKKLSFSMDIENYEYTKVVEPSPKQTIRKDRRHSHIERSGKTASKRRREYRKEQRALQLYESIKEPEEILQKSTIVEEQEKVEDGSSGTNAAKVSVFSRFFRSHRASSLPQDRHLQRDYSMDETTSKLFNEFMRDDIEIKPESGNTSNIASKINVANSRRNDRLSTKIRSATDSGVRSKRRLSPEDSIEEEQFFDDVVPIPSPCSSSSSTRIGHDIPIIKLPEETI